MGKQETSGAARPPIKPVLTDAATRTQTFDDFLHFVRLRMLHRNKNTRTIANSRAFLHTPVVSSTL
jgi:hypothetical protein